MALKNKKGVSTIVATVLIILITIVVAGLLAQVIIPYVRNNLQRSSECIPYQKYFQFEDNIQNKNYNCFKKASGGSLNVFESSIKVIGNEKADPGNINGFNIVFTDVNLGTSELFSAIKGPSGNSGVLMLESPQSSIIIPSLTGDVLTYQYNSKAGYDSSKTYTADVYPVLKSGRICDKSDTIKLVNPCPA